MPAQFPNHLVVTRPRRVQILNQSKIIETCFDAAGIIPPPMDLRAGLDGQPQNWNPMAPDLAGESNHLLSEGRTREFAGGLSRVRQWKTRREVVDLSLRRPGVEIRVGELLFQAKRDFAGSSQGVFYRAPPSRIAIIETGCATAAPIYVWHRRTISTRRKGRVG